MNIADVRKYIIKGVWYFDRIATELKYRPIAIGPVAVSAEDKFEQTNDDTGVSEIPVMMVVLEAISLTTNLKKKLLQKKKL